MVLMVFRVLFSVIVVVLASYGLITKSDEFSAYTTLFLGLMMLTMGIDEWQKKNKRMGAVLIVAFVFALFVSIQSFISN